MLRALAAAVLLALSGPSWALSPYIQGESLRPAATAKVAEEAAARLKAAGFQVLGQYFPRQLPDYGVVVVADEGLLNEIRALGGATIVGAAIRVGVRADGGVIYMNPDYWYRAYFRGQFPKAEKTVRAVQEKLARALGAGLGVVGDVHPSVLPVYRYALGMERFDSDNSRLAEQVSFDEAVRALRDNLDKETAFTHKVYEVVMPDEKLAVFGVAMDDAARGDGAWLTKIGGQQSIAALPYEVFVVNTTVYALYGRYRIALSFPDFGMAQFLRIVSTPEDIREMLGAVAGAQSRD